MKFYLERIFKFVFSILFIFVFVQGTFASENIENIYKQKIENKYQEKVFNTFENKYPLDTLSEKDLATLNNLIKISNKENYKLIVKIIKNDDFSNLTRISDTEINSNLHKENANKKMYETAYILLRKGLFTEYPDENLIKPVVKIMYDCDKVDNYNLAIYGATYLYHKEDKYDLKELLNNTNKKNFKEKLEEITSDGECDLKRFFPECKEMAVLVSNLPEALKDKMGIKDTGEYKSLSPAKCIISPNYYVTNMLLISTGLDGGTKKGAVIGLINPINIVSNVFLAPIYLLGNYLSPAIKEMK